MLHSNHVLSLGSHSILLYSRKGVTIKIVQHYKDIIDYLWFVSEKFDDHMNDVS